MNSVANIANPTGIIMNAGPGKTIIATPTTITKVPTTPITMRLTPGESAFSRMARRNFFQKLSAIV